MLSPYRCDDIDSRGFGHLNMNPLEYVYCHKRIRKIHGFVVLSEFAMPSEVMNGAIIVNPFNLSSVTRALEKAVRMSKQERGLRIARDIDHVKLASSKWSRRVLEALDEVWSPAAGSYAMAQLNELVDIDAVAEDSGARPKINQRSNIREQNAQLSTHEISEILRLECVSSCGCLSSLSKEIVDFQLHVYDLFRNSTQGIQLTHTHTHTHTHTQVHSFRNTKEFECVEKHSET